MWTTTSPGERRSRRSRGTTRRIALGLRTRTVPNSSRSVTSARPSGPPSNPPLRLRSIRAMAPGGGASVTRWTMPTAWPASPSSSASRGAWSLARTTLAFSPTQCSTPSTRRSVRPGGSTGSRQPNWSPLVRLFEANAMPSAAPASDCQVSSSVLRAVEVALPVARRQVGETASPSAGRRPRPSPRAAPRPGATGSRRRRRGRRARRGRGGSTGRGGRGRSSARRCEPRPRRRRRRAATGPRRPWRPTAASPAKRSRSWARRSGRRAAIRPSRSRITRRAAGRQQELGRRAGGRPRGRRRCCVGRWGRRRAGSRSRRRTARSGPGRGADGGNTSTMPPRRANSPRPATSITGV